MTRFGSRHLLRTSKAGVQVAFESLWTLGFWVLGRSRRRVERWSPAGPQGVMVLAPHPDDEVCGCGGTAILHREAGDPVVVVYITDGRRSTAYGLGPEEIARRRQREAGAAAAALGVQFCWLGLPEGEWEPDELASRLESLLEVHAPRVVYAPCQVDFHPEHHRVARTLAHVLARSPLPEPAPLIRVYQLQVPLTPALTNLVAETSSVMARSRLALEAYTTQQGAILPSLRLKRYTASYFSLSKQGEEFWQMSSQDYQRLHLSASAASPGGKGFRSFRHYAWSDPLAYIVGLGERRRLAHSLRREEPGSPPGP